MGGSELRAHVEHKFAAAELHRYPFPHLVIADFFPAPVYAEILRRNPFRGLPGTEWFTREKAPQRTQTPYWLRRQVALRMDEPVAAADDADRAFWTAIRDCFLADDWFERLVLEKYREYFALRFGELAESRDFFAHFRKELFLQRHEPGYSIGPHTDVPARVFTCLFSFADRPGFEAYGTELCVPRDPLVRCWGNGHHAPEGFDVARVAPYAPNHFLLFFKTRQSFHSVRAIDAAVPNQRYGMQLQLYEARGGIFTDLSEPELFAPKLDRPGLRTRLARAWSALTS